ncbi:MAG: VWA domain-containing protein [Thiotrichales bacterium]|nr:VWA domain-containing protein [Thiotrichales bacterium]
MIELITAALTNFHFIRPLWLLAIIPLLLIFIGLVTAKFANKRWADVIDPDLLTHLLDNSATVKKRWPIYILAIAWLVSCLGLSGPSWQRLPQAVEKKADIMIVIVDMTLSMYATDVTPSRLLRARYKLLELLAQRKEGHTALIAYSGDAHIVSPLTDDSRTIAALVPALAPEVMPSIGSNAGAAFDMAAELLVSLGGANATVVWLTDELLNKDRSHIESLLNRYAIDLVVLGIGSERGGLMKLPDGKFIKDNKGNLITAKLNRNELQRFVAEQGGRYTDLRSDNSDIEYALSNSLFNNKGELSNDDSSQRTVERWQDQGAWLALLLIPIVLFSFRRGWVLSIACVAVLIAPHDSYAADEPSAWAATWQGLWLTKDQQAKKLLEHGDADQAAEKFQNRQWQGAANFSAEKYKEAVKSFEGINEADAHYNRGHALAHDGQLEDAIAAYGSAIELNPNMEDAKTSKSIIEQMLKQQQSQDGEGENSDEQQEASESEQSQDSQQKGGSSDSSSDQSQEGKEQSEPSEQTGEESEKNQAGQGEEENSEEQQSLAQSENDTELAEENEKNAVPPPSQPSQLSEAEQLSAEQSQALQQWLRQIPDDPAGLLRRKFQYERQLKQREGTVVEAEEDGQIW